MVQKRKDALKYWVLVHELEQACSVHCAAVGGSQRRPQRGKEAEAPLLPVASMGTLGELTGTSVLDAPFPGTFALTH